MVDDIPIIKKAPAEKFYIRFNWAPLLAEVDDDTIAVGDVNSTWIVTPVVAGGVTVDRNDQSDTTTTIRILTGELNKYYLVTNHIKTVDEQEFEQSIKIRVRVK